MEPDWDRRYREGSYSDADDAHELVKRYVSLMPHNGPVIDVAMGRGRDLLFLARAGFRVCGIERSQEAIKLTQQAARREGLSMPAVLGDARSLPFRMESAGTVLVFYFLQREILTELTRLLVPGGLLLYETFLKRQNEIDRARDVRYLLEDGELLERFRHLELLMYEEGIFDVRGRQRAVARFVGRQKCL